MLTQGGLAEHDQPVKNPLKYSTTAGNRTRATGKTDSEIHSLSHWAIMTQAMERTEWDTFILPLSYHVPGVTGKTDSDIHSFSH